MAAKPCKCSWKLVITLTCCVLAPQVLSVQAAECVYRFSIFVSGSSGISLQQWEVTFLQYLNQELSSQLECVFNATPTYRVPEFSHQLAQDQLDFALLDATTFACLSSQFGVVPLASIVRLDGSRQIYSAGAAVAVSAADPSITSLAHLAGKRVTFTAKGQEFTASPWLLLEAIQSKGVDIFTDCAEVLLADSIDDLILDILRGRTDAALLRSDAIPNLQRRGLVNASAFKFVDAAMMPDYPYPTSVQLIPDSVVVAAASVPSNVRKAVALALFRITRDMYPARAASYSTFVPPYSYAAMFRLLQKQGLMQSDGLCHPDADLYNSFSCPPNTTKVAEIDMPEHCRQSNVSACPQGYQCYCRPCRPMLQPHMIAAQMATSVAVAVAVSAFVFLSATGALLYLVKLQAFSMPMGLHDIPYKDLDLNSNSTVVGHTRHCVIYQTMYCGMPVTVKRLLPPRDPKTRTLFSLSSISRISPSSSHDAVLPLDSTPGLLHSSSDGPVAPMMLARASSQGLLPAGDCHSFAAQVQTDGPLQRWDRLCATVKAAKTALQQFAFHALSGQYFRQMQQRYEVLKKIAAHTKVNHPNIVSILGVSQYPGTKDLLLVSEWLAGGTVKDMVHNVSVPLDVELVVSILNDVAVAMAYFYQLQLPIGHQQLTTTQVLLDSSCKAHLRIDYLQTGDAHKADNLLDRIQAWLPPEAGNADQPGPSSNVYAFGMLMYELMFCREPDVEEVSKASFALGQKTFVHPRWSKDEAVMFPPELIKLMQRCWHHEASSRPTFEGIKLSLTEIASTTFNCAASEASHLSRAKSQALLGQMLPAKVIAALRDGRTPEPESYACVTVIFCDIVDFSDLLTILEPRQVMELLDRLYHILDNLALQWQLFKVETIGCTYMVVGNLQPALPDHVAKACWFALDAHKATQSVPVCAADPLLGNISLKIGMHCGPVVANVVGTANPRYCLFGDTVNIASRMDSSSLSGRIQMSKPAAHLAVKQDSRLQHHISARPGLQMVKGKGPMQTYWLEPEPGLRHWRTAHNSSGDTSFNSAHTAGPDDQPNRLQSRSADQRRQRNASFAFRIARKSTEQSTENPTCSTHLDAHNPAGAACDNSRETGTRNKSARLVGQQEWALRAEQRSEAQPDAQRSISMPDAAAGPLPGPAKSSGSSALYSLLTEKQLAMESASGVMRASPL